MRLTSTQHPSKEGLPRLVRDEESHNIVLTVFRYTSGMAPAELNPATFDRTDFSPLHEGPNILPHDLIFHRLHFLATNQPSIAIKDAHKGYEITYPQLLSHIIQTRNHIRENLSGRSTQMLRNGEEVSLMIVARGYEFVVSFFAVLALGGIVVPQSKCSFRYAPQRTELSDRSSYLSRGTSPCSQNMPSSRHSLFGRVLGADQKYRQQA